jgi:outer membrane murein-binding lipoprotein Lpp
MSTQNIQETILQLNSEKLSNFKQTQLLNSQKQQLSQQVQELKQSLKAAKQEKEKTEQECAKKLRGIE